MATTCKLIAKQTLSGNAATVTFSDIPQTYTDLMLVASARTDISDYGSWATFNPNGDTANVSGRSLYFGGTSALSTSYSSGNVGYFWTSAALHTANCFSNTELYMPNYAGSTNKSWSVTAIGETNNATQALMGVAAFVWNSTAALTSFTLDPQGTGNFISGSSFYLYGITRVDDNTPGRFGIQATGGQEVYESGGYKYHVFKSSGTFTVSEPGWVECLVVAGGGGGGTSNGGGGGGGGGVLYSSGIFINSGSYLTTVGAGGVNSNGNDSSFLNFTAIGGGGGANVGSAGVPGPGYNGGSGGGGRYQSGSGGSALQSSVFGATGYGNIGGSAALSTGSPFPSAGGGGAGAAGGNTTSSAPGNGGNGIQIFGNYYSGGGGGTTFSTAASSTGGLGGGGNGPAGNGTANTGGGGAGDDNAVAGGIGGSGIVIIRYPI